MLRTRLLVALDANYILTFVHATRVVIQMIWKILLYALIGYVTFFSIIF